MNTKADPFLWAAGRILDRLAAASTRAPGEQRPASR